MPVLPNQLGDLHTLMSPLLRRLESRNRLGVRDQEALREAIREIRTVRQNRVVVHEGDLLAHSLILFRGFMCRYKELSEGRRQITELQVAGDFVDLHGFTLKRLDHNIMALSDCCVGVVPHDRLTQITENNPQLTRLLWFVTNLDAAVHREWVLSLGRRTALQRMSHLFCELQSRLHIAGLINENEGFVLPLTQTILADCLGLTTVHVNRVIRELRLRDIVDMQRGEVLIRDIPALREIAEYDPNFLHPNDRAH